MSELPVGASLDKYVVQSRLFGGHGDEGAMYVVVPSEATSERTWLCHDVGPTPTTDDVKTAYAEAVALVTSYKHAGVASVVEALSVGGREYLILDGPRGPSLSQLLTGSEVRDSTFREWAVQLCDALSAVDSKLPCLLFDRIDPLQVLSDSQGGLRIVNFRLGRILGGGTSKKVVGTVDEDRAQNYSCFADLLSSMMQKRKSHLDTPSSRKLAAVVQRCNAFLQTPGLSFQEIRRSIQQALPEEAVAQESKLAAEARGVWAILSSISIRTWLSLATGLAVILVVANLFRGRPVAFPVNQWALYTVCDDNKLQFVDGPKLKVTHGIPLFAPKVEITDLRVVANGTRLLIADKGEGFLRVLDTKDQQLGMSMPMSPGPSAILGGYQDRVVYVIGGVRCTEVSVLPFLKVLHSFALGGMTLDSCYALDHVEPDRKYLFYTAPKFHNIAVVDLATLANTKTAIPAPATASCMATSPDGKELWLATKASSEIYVINLNPLIDNQNTSACTVMTTISQPECQGPQQIVFSPDGKQAAIVYSDSNSVLLVNVDTHKVIGVIGVEGTHPVACQFNRAEGGSTSLYIANQDSDTIDVASLDSLKVVNTITRLGGSPSVLDFVKASE